MISRFREPAQIALTICGSLVVLVDVAWRSRSTFGTRSSNIVNVRLECRIYYHESSVPSFPTQTIPGPFGTYVPVRGRPYTAEPWHKFRSRLQPHGPCGPDVPWASHLPFREFAASDTSVPLPLSSSKDTSFVVLRFIVKIAVKRKSSSSKTIHR